MYFCFILFVAWVRFSMMVFEYVLDGDFVEVYEVGLQKKHVACIVTSLQGWMGFFASNP